MNLNEIMALAMRQPIAKPSAAPPTTPPGGSYSMFKDPSLMMAMGILGGNYGRDKRAAFANSMRGGLDAMGMANMVNSRNEQEELARREYEMNMAEVHQKRMQAALMLQNADPEFVKKYFPAGAADPDSIRSAMKDSQGPEAVRRAQYFASPEGNAVYKQLEAQYGPDKAAKMIGGGGVTVNAGGAPKSQYEIMSEQLGKDQFLVADPNAPGGYRAQAIAGTGQTKDKAGMAAMLEAAKAGLPVIEDIIFDGDPMAGEINRGALFGKAMANVTIPFTDVKPIPGALIDSWKTTKGGQLLASMYEKGIQGITRLETGAAMPDTELSNTRARFEPGPGDSIDAIREKYIAYKIFLNDATSYLKDGFISNPSAENINWDKLFKEAKSTKSSAMDDEALIRKYMD